MMISAANTSMLFHSLPMVGALKANGLSPDKAALAVKEAKSSVEQVGRIQKGPEGKAALRDALKARIADDVASGKLSADDASIVMRTFQEMDPANQRGGQPPAGQDAPQDGGANQPPPRRDRPAPAGDEQNPPPEGAGGPPPGGPGGPPPGGPGGPPPQGAGGPPPGEAGGARPPQGAGGPPPAGGASKAGGSGQSSAQKTVLSESVIVTGMMMTTTTLYTDGTSDTKTEAISNQSPQNPDVKKALANYMNASAQAKEGPAQMQSYLSSIKPGSLFDFLIH